MTIMLPILLIFVVKFNPNMKNKRQNTINKNTIKLSVYRWIDRYKLGGDEWKEEIEES